MSNPNSRNQLFVLVRRLVAITSGVFWCQNIYLGHLLSPSLHRKVVCILAVSVMRVAADGPITIIKNLIQGNLAGIPVTHEVTVWDFDPEVAVKRRELFERAHGFRGERLIERMGLGIDGLHDIRLVQQQARDDGLLGGTIHHIKSGLNTLD